MSSNQQLGCAQVDELLCDYIDGLLTAENQAFVDEHLASCRSCSELAQDARAAVAFLENVDEVQAPPELVTRILFHTSPEGLAEAEAARPVEPRPGLAAWFSSLFQPILQPKFAMGMAMTVLSFSMIGRVAGVDRNKITAEDFSPTAVWANLDDKAHRTWRKAVKYYENLRVVYEIQNRLDEWAQEADGDRRPADPIDTTNNNRTEERNK